MSQSNIKQHFYVIFESFKIDQVPFSGRKEDDELVSCIDLWMAHKKSKMVFEKQFSIKECRDITRNIMPISSLIKIIEQQVANPVHNKRLSTKWEITEDSKQANNENAQLTINISYTPDEFIGTRVFELRLPATGARKADAVNMDADRKQIFDLKIQINKLQEQVLKLQVKHKMTQTASTTTSYTEEKSNLITHSPVHALVPTKPYFQPEVLVFTFNHGHQEEEIGDPSGGSAWASRYYHITTPIHTDHRIWWRYTLKGYSYGAAYPIDIIFVGYIFQGQFYQVQAVNLHASAFPNMKMTQYLDSNNQLVLKFGPISRFCNTLSLYYQGTCGNQEFKDKHGLQIDKYKIQVTADDVQITE